MQDFERGGGSKLLGLYTKGSPALVPMLKSLHREPKGANHFQCTDLIVYFVMSLCAFKINYLPT